MKKIFCLPLVLALPFLCRGAVVSPSAAVDKDFEHRRSVITDKKVFDVFADPALGGERREAMKFLYAYMPLPDISAYTSDFFLSNVDASLQARDEMPWGTTVPDREFRHFVLPVRVNNENLDLSRPVFYEELKERVKGLTMAEAILEVNHWCHEKVTYQPSDSRTSSPLSSVSQAIGRCGEESTFTVAALRSVGIPARQVYTPRWAHTDDNHAWVEAWADGEWHFLGACEPAPILDMAWFNSPASRGMLMNTNVFGRYDGPEEKLRTMPVSTTINVTRNYAPVADLQVCVTDLQGNPVEGAAVSFMLYNYAEFYPVASKVSDADGRASLTVGLGDMVVWATDGNRFGFSKGSAVDGTPVKVVLDKDASYEGVFELEIVPPSVSGNLPKPSQELTALNDMRLHREDSIRMAYTSTFMTADDGRELAGRLATDPEKTAAVFAQTRGNGKRLAAYLSALPAGKRGRALDLLTVVSEKDRRDIPVDVIDDHITNTPEVETAAGLYEEYVLNPRIDREGLTPYKSYFRENVGDVELQRYRSNPSELVAWVSDNVELDTDWNPQLLRMDPRAVWRERRADAKSRDIMFVALARTAGIPARIDPVTGKTQMVCGGNTDWTDVTFGGEATDAGEPSSAKSSINLSFEKTGRVEAPKYYSQFSISRVENGALRLREYDENAPWGTIGGSADPFDAGQYLMVTGQRMADGSVLARGEFFRVAPDAPTDVAVVLRQDTTGVQVIGNLNAENIYHDLATDTDKGLIATTGRGYYILGIIKASDEPTAHALNEIMAQKGEFEKWGKNVMLLFGDEREASRFDRSPYAGLPSTAVFGIDNGSVSLNELVESLNLENEQLPVFVIADTFNRVVFVSQGYTIGLADRLLSVISQLKE